MIYGNILKTGMGIKTIRCGLIAFLVPIVVTIIIRCVKRQSAKRAIETMALLLYIVGILWLTVGGRSSDKSQINLTPFWSYSLFANPEYRWQIYMNVFLLIPFGFLLALSTKRGFLFTVLIGLLFSIGIEAAQYLFHLGFCEFDDVFHNTLGTALGYGYGRLLSGLERKLEKPIGRILGEFRDAFVRLYKRLTNH